MLALTSPRVVSSSVLAALALAAPPAVAQCPAWTEGLRTEFSGVLLDATTFDSGAGPELVLAGTIASAGDVATNGVVRWDGTDFAPLGAGVDGTVNAVLVHDDGSGPALYAAGSFAEAGGAPAASIARWDGAAWSALGAGLDGDVDALAALGGELVALGDFTTAGGVPATGFATWNGSTWSVPSAGTDGTVYAATTFDDGGGAALFVGGQFTTAGGVLAANLARWDGTSWSAAGDPNARVVDLAVADDGSGLALYASGFFTSVGGVTTNGRIARWDGTSWSAADTDFVGGVVELAVLDSGGGPELHALSTYVDFDLVSLVQRYSAGSWQAVSSGPFQICFALGAGHAGGGSYLFCTGQTPGAPEFSIDRGIGAWDGSSWTLLGQPDQGVDGPVHALAHYDSGAGEELYAAGELYIAGQGLEVDGIARWDGTGWTELNGGGLLLFGGGAPPRPRALEVYAGELYVAGQFTQASFVANTTHVARYDGTAWSSVSTGASAPVWALHAADLGSGERLFLGGQFTQLGGVATTRIASWDGTTPAPLGTGVDGIVRALTSFGNVLVAGGEFTQAGGVAASRIAAWDGTGWSALGAGLDGDVLALCVWDDGSGEKLYAGGTFDNAGGAPAHRIACWDGTAWSALPGSFTWNGHPFFELAVEALEVTDGLFGGPRLAVGGTFDSVAGLSAGGLATWDGAQWSTDLGSTDGRVHALRSGTAELWVGGAFAQTGHGIATGADAVPATNVAHLADLCGAAESGAYCFGTDGACPCGNGGAEGAGCDLAQGTGGVKLELSAFAPDGLGGGRATLSGSGFPTAATPAVVAIRSTGFELPPVVFGDGLRCVGLAGFTRVGATFASGGVATRALTHGAGAGGFYYQLWFRNQPAMYCDPAAAFNLSNGYELTW